MKILTTLAIIFTLNLGFAQTQQVILDRTGEDMFTSMKHSVQHDRLFAGDKKGQISVIDAKQGRLINTVKVGKSQGTIHLDNIGALGAFSDNSQMIRFFNQKTLKVVDSVQMPKVTSYIIYSVWFTEHSVLVGNNEKNYRYDLVTRKLTPAPELDSYRILDYSLTEDKLLLGFWDKSIPGDGNKINTLYIAKGTKLYDKQLMYSSSEVINAQTGAYMMEHGTKIVVLDKSGINIVHFNNKSGIAVPNAQIRAIAKLDDMNLFYSVRTKDLIHSLKSYNTSYKENRLDLALKYASYNDNIFKTNSDKIYVLNSYDGTKTRIIVIQ